DEHGVQHHRRDGNPAGLLGAAEHHVGGGGDHAGGGGDGGRREQQHGDGVHGERDARHRDQSVRWGLVRDGDACGVGWGGDVRRAVDRQGRDRVHAHGNGGRKRDQHGVQYHRGDGDAAGVLGAAEHHVGGGGDH